MLSLGCYQSWFVKGMRKCNLSPKVFFFSLLLYVKGVESFVATYVWNLFSEANTSRHGCMDEWPLAGHLCKIWDHFSGWIHHQCQELDTHLGAIFYTWWWLSKTPFDWHKGGSPQFYLCSPWQYLGHTFSDDGWMNVLHFQTTLPKRKIYELDLCFCRHAWAFACRSREPDSTTLWSWIAKWCLHDGEGFCQWFRTLPACSCSLARTRCRPVHEYFAKISEEWVRRNLGPRSISVSVFSFPCLVILF